MKEDEIQVGMKVLWSGPVTDCKDQITGEMNAFYKDRVFVVSPLSHGRCIWLHSYENGEQEPVFSALAYPEELTKYEEKENA